MSISHRYVNRLKWTYRKNRADLKGILAGHYPDFVLPGGKKSIRGELPVFVFHSVAPESFKSKLQYLEENGYTTLTGDHLLQVMEREKALPERPVVLTFDDGMASLYSVAFPLLREFNFRAIGFIIPGCIPESAPETSTYEDWRAGHASRTDLLERERGGHPLCSWEEIQEMHRSGIIDFQAHSTYHHLIHVSPDLVDFLHPGYDRHVANFNVPAYPVNRRQDFTREVENGAPVFRFEPRMSGRAQYFDSEEIRKACIQFVDDRGGEDFFKTRGWRRRLTRFYQDEKENGAPGGYETEAETRQAIFDDLEECKAAIEQELRGSTVKHFCFPWFTGSQVAVEQAQRAGYEALYWGFLDDVEANRPGGDPLRIVRLQNRYLYRLPGAGRKPLSNIIGSKLYNMLKS